MNLRNIQGLALLDPRDLARITGSGGELGLSIQTPPLRGLIDLTYHGPRGAIAGTLTVTDKDWAGGLRGTVKLGKATLEGSFSTNTKAWEIQARLRIPLGR